MTNKYEFDVFIAYHGTYSSEGSYDEAKNIASYLRKNNFSVYLFEEENGETWSETPKKIVQSRTMLVVLNKSVLLDGNSFISKTRMVGGKEQPYQIFVEIQTFISEVNAGNKSPQTLNFIYCGDDKNREEARAFCSRQACGLDSLNNIIAKDYKGDGDNNYSPIKKWLSTALEVQRKWDERENVFEKESLETSSSTFDDVFDTIETEMFKQNCIAVVGPAINKTYERFLEGEYQTFFEKCKSIKEEGKNLDKELKTIEPVLSRDIQHIVKFPFSAFITTDEYSNICEYLKQANKVGQIIKNDNDIFNLDLQGGEVPVFQLNRSEKCIDDCLEPSANISTVLKMLLRGKKIIYLGFDDNYDGYKRISQVLRKVSGDEYFTWTNNVVMLESATNSHILIDKQARLTLVNVSVDEFVKRVEASNEIFKKLLNMNDGNNKFIIDLFRIASTPTETQAIKLLLEQLETDIESCMELPQIIEKYDNNVSCLKTIKPNFNAFVKCWERIRNSLLDEDNLDITELEFIVQTVKTERSNISRGISKQGKELLTTQKEYNIVMFSQSLRVIEFLNGSLPDFKKNTNLYICECRPKSFEPFVDSKNSVDLILDSQKGQGFKSITIIPDMAAFNLMDREKIDALVLGAHDVVFHDDKPISFINTCGTIGLLEFAKKKNISTFVVAETGKFTNASANDKGDLIYSISYGHESTIFNDLKFALWAKKNHVITRNIGYDYCAFYKGVKLVSEKGCIVCDEPSANVKLIDTTRDIGD